MMSQGRSLASQLSILSLISFGLIFLLSCARTSPQSDVQSESFLETKVVRGGKIWSMDWSPDDRYIACGNSSGLLRIYHADNFELDRVLTGFKATINGIHWSPDGRKILASGGNDDPRLMLWDIEGQSMLVIEAHARQVRSVRWSPKGNYFASTSHDGTIRIWTKEGAFYKSFAGATGGCVGIDWLDEDIIIASCWDNTIRKYSLSGADSLLIENGNHRYKAILAIDWHPSGDYFVAGEYGNEGDTVHAVKLWRHNGELIKQMNSHEKEIRSLSWNSDGSLLATGGETVRLWDADGDLIRIFEPIFSPIWSLDWDEVGKRIISGHNDGKIRMWNTDGDLLKTLNGHSSESSSIAYNKDSSQLLVGFADGSLRYFNLNTLQSDVRNAGHRSIKHITWSPDQEHVALCNNDGTFFIWKINNSALEEHPFFSGSDLDAKSLAWHPDSRSVAYLDYSGKIHVYPLGGSMQYDFKSTDTDHNKLVWQDGVLSSISTEDVEDSYGDEVIVSKGGKRLLLIPMSDNQFALIEEDSHQIIHGDSNDFVEVVSKEDGFTEIRELK